MFSFLLGKYPGLELLGHWVNMFNFVRNCHFIFLLAMYESSICFITLLKFSIASIFNFSQPTGWNGISCGFILHFSDNHDVELFTCLLLHLWNVCSNIVSNYKIRLSYWVKSPVYIWHRVCQMHVLKIFSPTLWLTFSFS